MSSTNLDSGLLAELLVNVKRSVSLHCVHLSGNHFEREHRQLLQSKLKVTATKKLEVNPLKADKRQALVDKVREHLRSHFKNQAEKVYHAQKTREVLEEWESLREDSERDPVVEVNSGNVIDCRFGVSKQALEPLVLSKVMGHPEIKNSKHWKMSHECYQCEKSKYSFIFWHMGLGKDKQIKNCQLEAEINQLIFENSKELQNLVRKNKISVESGPKVYISGSFTNWEPRRMLQIDELCAFLQGK